MTKYLLAIDQGTTNSRAIIFNQAGQLVAQAERSMTQYYPSAGWVEHDPEEMVKNTLDCCKQVLQKAALTIQSIVAIGMSNQRETTIIWDKRTGLPIHHAIVWQDRRTSDFCQALLPHQARVQAKTGLLLDPYFSASKIAWLLDHIPNARQRAENGELLFGTVDTYLLWKLTKGQAHLTDITNASRTLLFNLQTKSWDQELLSLFNIPSCLLPTIVPNAYHFGDLHPDFLGAAIPIMGMVGDQQAATIGQACFEPGMVKATFGTGCFLMLNSGTQAVKSHDGLLTTVAYQLEGQTIYGVEGSMFCAGIIIKWLRDKLKLIASAAETETLAASIPHTDGVYMLPAFTGLGAPYWQPNARGALLGMTLNTTPAHIVRAALESLAYQVQDLLQTMLKNTNMSLQTLRVDGGMVANNWFLQFLADQLQINVERPQCIETTALGAAYVAGLQAGVFAQQAEVAALWQQQACFSPQITSALSHERYAEWRQAIDAVISRVD